MSKEQKSKFDPASITEFLPQEIKITRETEIVKGVRVVTKTKSYGRVLPEPDEHLITDPHLRSLYELIDDAERYCTPYYSGIHHAALSLKDYFEKKGITLSDIKGEGYTYTRSWIIGCQGTINKHKAKATDDRYSKPLKWNQWADILGMSGQALRAIREAENPIYQFRKTRKNARKWCLRWNDMPGEFLEKYRKELSQSQPKTQ